MTKQGVMNGIYDLIMNNKKQDESFIKGFQEGYIQNQDSIVLIDEPLGVRYTITIKEGKDVAINIQSSL
jgi:hypothetical protein